MTRGTIINQDRDAGYLYNSSMSMSACPNIKFGEFFGINLYLEEHLLGTFDTPGQAAVVMDAILRCEREVYEVPGYHSGEEFEFLMKGDLEDAI